QILAAGSPGLEASRALVRQRGLVRRAEICGASEEPGDVLREDIEHLGRGVATGEALGIGREDGKVLVPSGGQLSSLHLIDLVRQVRMPRLVRSKEGRPLASQRGATRPDAGGKVLADAIGDEKLGVLGPAVEALAETHLLITQRLAVSRRRILLV